MFEIRLECTFTACIKLFTFHASSATVHAHQFHIHLMILNVTI